MQTTIAGYEVVSKLGQGGMGTVYEVRDGAGQKLALKVLRHLEDVSALAAERFRREFSLLSRLRHPNLVSVMQSDITDGSPYYTMELVTGQTINQVPVYTRRPGPDLWGVHNPIGFRVLFQLLDGIEYMHQHGIVHRDLKP
ncbi:MAG: protein kinase domain-containing protein, partial [Candidatus Xenobia bacterium]